MNDTKNQQKLIFYFTFLFFIINLIDVLTYILFPLLTNNIAFLLIGIFNIILDSILLFCMKYGIGWAKWTFIISLIMKSGILISTTLDDLFTFYKFNTKYVILAIYVVNICILLFSKKIELYYNLCSKFRYYVEQCRDYIKSRYNVPMALKKQSIIEIPCGNNIVMPFHSIIDNCSFFITIKDNIIYDNYFECYFNNEINSKIKYEIKKYALKSEEPYADKLLNAHISNDTNTDGLEFNIDSSINIFEDYKEKVPPYEVFYEKNSSQNHIFNFTYSMTIDSNDIEFNVKYIYLVLHILRSFNYKFDLINFYACDTHADFSHAKIYNDSNYIIQEMSYSEACNILMNQDLSYIKEKLDSYITNLNE